MQKKLKRLYSENKRLVRYFIMAVLIVGIELVTFQIVYLLTKNYYLATIVSFITGVVLNWIGGRLLIFGSSHHHPLHEFIMVLTASVGGLLIQLGAVSASVQLLGLYPLIGKMLSIVFSFFWNYWFRAAIIYNKPSNKKSQVATKRDTSAVVTSVLPFIVVGIVASIIFFIRFPNNFTEPNFYAEDGSIFLTHIYQHGFFDALFTTFNGYYIVGLYLIEGFGYIVNTLFFHNDFLSLAKSFAIASYTFLGFTCALPVLLFRKYLNVYAIALTVFLSVFVPMPSSDYAIIGTIGNLKFIFVYIAFLLLVYRHLIPGKNWRQFIAIDFILLLCAYTNVIVYLLLPFALVRYIPLLKNKRFKEFFRQHSVQSLIGLGVLLIPQIIVIKIFGIPTLPGYLDTPYKPASTINLFFYRPFVFELLPYFEKHMSDLLAIVSFVILAITLWFGMKKRRAILMFGMIASFLATLLFVINRTGISSLFLSYLSSGPDQFFYTQNLITCFLVSVAVVTLVALIKNLNIRFSVIVLIALFIIFAYIPASGTFGKNDFMQRTVKNIYLNAQAACIKQTAHPNIQLYPVISSTFQLRDIRYADICTPDLQSYVPDTEYLPFTSSPGTYIADIVATPVRQTFVSDYDGLSGVSPVFLTYKAAVRDIYDFTLYDATCLTKLRSVAIDPGSIHDTVSTRIGFDRINSSRGKTYCMAISLKGTKTSPLAVSVSGQNLYPEGQLTVDKTVRTDDLVFELHYSK